MDYEKILEIVRKEFDEQRISGRVNIPPHQHDGVDNLQINPINFQGYSIFSVASASTAPTDAPVSGTIRFQYDGTTFTMWVMNGTTWKQIGASTGLEVKEIDGTPDVTGVTIVRVSNGTLTNNGGGQVTINTAGSPGGADGDLQINDSGAFGTIGGLTLDKTGDPRGTLALDIQTFRGSTNQVASGDNAITIGQSNKANQNGAVAIGIGNTVTGASNAYGFGTGNVVAVKTTMALGIANTISGGSDTGFAFGRSNSVSGNFGMAMGTLSTVAGQKSLSVGYTNTAGGDFATSVGNGNVVGGTDAQAFGIGNTASNAGCTAVGDFNTCSGSVSMAFGDTNNCVGDASMSFGSTNHTSNDYGIALGVSNTVGGVHSVAIGDLNTTSADYAFIIGSNSSNTDAHSIKIGSGNSTFVSNICFNGTGSYGGGKGVLYIATAITNPSSNPVGGGLLYIDSATGSLTFRGSAGTTTVIAPA